MRHNPGGQTLAAAAAVDEDDDDDDDDDAASEQSWSVRGRRDANEYSGKYIHRESLGADWSC